MKVTGSATVAAPRERVYAALRDPAVLARTIPGCQGLETVGPDSYRLTISAGVAAIRGTYSGSVALSEPEPPSSFVLRARGQGAPGTVDATVRVLLSEDGGTSTRVEYDADATVGGMVGGVGQRLLAGAARKTATEFFAAVARDLTGPVTAEVPEPDTPRETADGPWPGTPRPGTPGEARALAADGPRPGTAREAAESDDAVPGLAPRSRMPLRYRDSVPAGHPGEARVVAAGVVAGAVAGALAALAGVALGAVIGRRR